MKLISQIETALADMAAGKFTGSVGGLLSGALTELKKQHVVKQAVDLTNHRAAWDSYRKYQKRLTEIATALIKAQYPEAEDVRIKDWSVLGNPVRAGTDVQFGLDVEWRLYRGEEYDEAEGTGRIEGTGYDGDSYITKRSREYMLTEWFWSDSWQELVEQKGRERKLIEAQREVDRLDRAMDEAATRLDENSKKLTQAMRRLAQLKGVDSGLGTEEKA